MPTYDYKCRKGHRFEVFQKMSDAPVAECPECGAAAERLISGGAGFLFKGEGFYITDYRSEEYKKKASSEAESLSGGSKADGGASAGDGASTKAAGNGKASGKEAAKGKKSSSTSADS
jgi:putative FmdB family regulatory protein